MWRRERGSVAPLLAVLVVAAGAAALGLGRIGGAAVARAQARTAADAAALARAEQLLGRPVPITSGYRSPDEQASLWARRASNPYPVAPPGTSMHELGLAIDVPSSFVATLVAIAPDVGLCHRYPVADPVHFEVCEHR